MTRMKPFLTILLIALFVAGGMAVAAEWEYVLIPGTDDSDVISSSSQDRSGPFTTKINCRIDAVEGPILHYSTADDDGGNEFHIGPTALAYGDSREVSGTIEEDGPVTYLAHVQGANDEWTGYSEFKIVYTPN